MKTPRLGFLGVGWIGADRLRALARSGTAEIAAVADPSEPARTRLLEAFPSARAGSGLDALLETERLDGVVIATPSALHAEQSIAVLDRGIPVFCQKPLGRTAAEVRAVVDTGRRADRLLGVDMSYRHTAAMRAIRDLVRNGWLGHVYAAELVFHNAYGPDGGWFYDRRLSGGGCVMDLGIHLVDLALWILGGDVEDVAADLFAGGRPLRVRDDDAVDDYAEIRLRLAGDRVVRIACSWNLNAGRDAVMEARFHGTERGASMVNIDGSFYDFRAELHDGTATDRIVDPPDDWGGRAAVRWARRLAGDASFDPEVEELVTVAEILDRIYGR